MTWRFQLSLRAIFLLITGIAIALAAVIQVPHVFVFALSFLAVSSAAVLCLRATNSRVRIVSLLALLATGAVFYVLSFGPLIALSEMERRITGQIHLGRLAVAYGPAMRLNQMQEFRWYQSQWIPQDAMGLHLVYPTHISPNLVGTWQTGGDQVVNLRHDGTGRAYGRPAEPLYFEWSSDASEFAIYQYSSKRNPDAWLGQVFMNYSPSDRYQVVESSATHFKLREKSGRIITLTKSHDTLLESAP